MQTAIEIIKAVLSWPTACIVAVIVFHRPIAMLVSRLARSGEGKVKVGGIEIELGQLAEGGKQAVSILNKINMVMADSRRLELEIFSGFGVLLTAAQSSEMKEHIDALEKLTEEAEKQLAADARAG